jgi:glycosyltransferase involved in cell wall biosynthesis
MKILRVINTLDLRTGGPASGVRALVPQLHAQGHDTTIVTLDPPGAAAHLDHCTVVPLGPAQGSYGMAPALLPWLMENVTGFDAVVVHGLWQSHGRCVRLAARRRGVPYFVYPHGMLDPWFRRAYPGKHMKKWLYWQLVERHVLRDAAAVLFTCEEERRLARRSFAPYACVERVVNYGTAGAPPGLARQHAAWQARVPGLKHRPFLLFLGRIHPKKGVDLLLQAWLALAERTPALPALVIAGPADNAELLQHLRSQAAASPAGASVFWTGMLEGDAKWGALRAAQALVLPSHQENFGLVVAEALAAGTPVLVSQQVNIWREIVADQAGLADADTAAGTLALLAAWCRLTAAQRATMRVAAAACYARRFHIDAVARSFTEVLQPFLAARPSGPSPS